MNPESGLYVSTNNVFNSADLVYMCPAKRFMIARPEPVSHVQATLNISKLERAMKHLADFILYHHLMNYVPRVI